MRDRMIALSKGLVDGFLMGWKAHLRALQAAVSERDPKSLAMLWEIALLLDTM